MSATDEQLARVRQLAEYSHGLHAEEAVSAVLAELTELRAEVDRLKALIDDMAFEDRTNDKGE